MFTKTDTSVDVPIAITQDTVCEDTESYNVTLASIEGGRIGSQCFTTLQISDDDG